MTKPSFAVAILLTLTMPARAADLNSANYMLPGCKGIFDLRSTHGWEQGRCAGFIQGLAYGVAGKDFCPPKEVLSVPPAGSSREFGDSAAIHLVVPNVSRVDVLITRTERNAVAFDYFCKKFKDGINV